MGGGSLLYGKHALTGCLRAQLETKHYEEEFDYCTVGLVGHDPAVGTRGRVHPVCA